MHIYQNTITCCLCANKWQTRYRKPRSLERFITLQCDERHKVQVLCKKCCKH